MNIYEHLKERHLNLVLYPNVKVYAEECMVFFPLFNLSNEWVGYQVYNPLAPKVRGNNDPRAQKYWTYVVGNRRGEKKLAVWGLETYSWTDKYLFVVEGIFDACRLHNLGLPCVATLCNDPKHLKSWLNTLSSKLVSVCDGDSAGLKLRNVSDESVLLNDGKDLGDMEEKEIMELLREYI